MTILTPFKLKRPKCEFILIVYLRIENFRIIEFLTDVENMLTEYFRPLSTYADLDKGFRFLCLTFAQYTYLKLPDQISQLKRSKSYCYQACQNLLSRCVR